MAMTYVQLFISYEEQLQLLTNEQVGNVVMAMMQYAKTGEEPELSGIEKMMFVTMRNDYNHSSEVYENTVKRNTENGKRGGRPKKTQEEKEEKTENPPVFSENPENPPVFSENPLDFSKTQKSQGKGKGKGKGQGYIVSLSSDYSAGAHDDDGENAAEKTTTTDSLDSLLALVDDAIGQQHLSKTIRGQVEQYAGDMGADLIADIVQECGEHGSRSWSYIRKAIENAKSEGYSSATEYRRRRKPGAVVDRVQPSGTNILGNHKKTIKLKREEDSP